MKTVSTLFSLACFASVAGLPTTLLNNLPAGRGTGSFGVVTLDFNPNIVGGEEATPGEFPWQCSLKQELIFGVRLHLCGAVIYDAYTVLTAAHCLEAIQADPGKVHIHCGVHSFLIIPEPWEQERRIQAFSIHPQRNITTKEGDLGYITLDQPLEWSERVQPIPFADSRTFQVAGKCTNTGWGNVRGDGGVGSSNVLRKVQLDLIPTESCKPRYGDLIRIQDSMICGGHLIPEDAEEQKGACNGDSGGPLVCPATDGRTYLVGLVSFGTRPCAIPQFPSVFANMMNLGSWIQQEIGSQQH